MASNRHVEVVKLEDVIEIRRGISWSTKQECKEPDDTTVPVVRIPNVQDRLDLADLLFLRGITHQGRLRYAVSRGWSLMVASNGNPDRVGNCVFIDHDMEVVFASFLIALGTRDSERLRPQFLYQLLCSVEIQRAITRNVQGSTGLSNINLDLLMKTNICLPPPSIQDQIITKLSSLDTTIDATRAVIAQARKFKTALLHDLLNHGLPGKKTKFRQVRLGDVFIERREKGIEGLPVMSVTASGLVRRDSLDRRVESDLRPDQHLLVRKGDIAYNMMRMWQGVFGLADFDGFVSPAYVVITPTQGMRPLYAKYLFEHPATVHLFHLYSQGIVEDRLRLYFEQFKSIPVRIVAEEKVQQQIADTLMAVDTRIATLSDELTRMSELKSALSQVLLMGQVQVKANEARQCRKK